MKTNIKNKALLLATLFLGLQPFVVMTMDNQKEEIRISKVQENGEAKRMPLEDKSRSWIFTSLLPDLSSMTTQVVNSIIINPAHAFVDSGSGFIVPGIALVGENVYGKMFGNRSYALTRTSMCYLAYGIMGYKIFRMQSMLSQIQQGVVNIQDTQTEHTQTLNTINDRTLTTDNTLKIVQKDVFATKLNTEDIQKKASAMQEYLDNLNTWAATINAKTDDISQKMSTKEQVERVEKNIGQQFTNLNIQMNKVETTGHQTSLETNQLTDMFKGFMQRSETDSKNIQKVLEDTYEIKTSHNELREHNAVQNRTSELMLKNQEKFTKTIDQLSIVLQTYKMFQTKNKNTNK